MPFGHIIFRAALDNIFLCAIIYLSIAINAMKKSARLISHTTENAALAGSGCVQRLFGFSLWSGCGESPHGA